MLAGVAACSGNGGAAETAADTDASASSSGSGSGSASTEPTASASAEGIDGDATATGGPGSPCFDEPELTDVVIQFTTNRVLGDDVVAAFDPAQGSFACAFVADDAVRFNALFGPFDFGQPRSSLYVVLYDGARIYDLATDPGPPGTGEPGLLELSYDFDLDTASSAGFGTINQGGIGTLDVIALPIDGGTTIEMAGVGNIAGEDGWQFDFTISATVPGG